jgi:hypothetical protein
MVMMSFSGLVCAFMKSIVLVNSNGTNSLSLVLPAVLVLSCTTSTSTVLVQYYPGSTYQQCMEPAVRHCVIYT